MTPKHRFRFQLWHLFLLVAIASLTVWRFTQIGMVTAEIELIEVDTWERTGDSANDDPNQPHEVINVVFQYVRPDDLANTRLNLFLYAPTQTANKLTAGDRFTFRYRVQPLLWLKPNNPDPIAIQRIGLDRDHIEEIITEIRMPE